MVGSMVVAENIGKTNIRSRNIQDFEIYIESLGEMGYEIYDAIFTEHIHKLDTPVFISLIVQDLEKAQVLKKIEDIIEVIGENCFIPRSKYCFIKCMKFLTGKEKKPIFIIY